MRPLKDDEENVLELADSQILVNQEKTFNFDATFSAERTQAEIYQEVLQEKVNAVLKGYNATIMAYGQTGSGKTFTIGLGGSTQFERGTLSEGFVTRALEQIFSTATASEEQRCVKIRFLEIVPDRNTEQVFDLINPSLARVPLQVRADQAGGFRLADVTERTVRCIEEAVEILKHGCKLRATEATVRNSVSSRSHAVLDIRVSDQAGGATSSLSLVDLAGSEAAGKIRGASKGDRFQVGVALVLF